MASSLIISELSPKEQEKKEQIIKKWNGINQKPKCIVFDLDMTLWPFLIDHKILFPLRKINHCGNEKIFDHNNNEVMPYAEVPLILETLKSNCIQNNQYMAVASRATSCPNAMQLIDLFKWTDYFDSIQIYSGTKQKHMKQIYKELNLKSFSEILFFDDSKLNLETTKSLGVIGHKVSRHYGLDVQEFLNGLKDYDSLCLKE